MNKGNRFASLRRKAGYTQMEVSEKIGVDQSAVAKWESGAAYPKVDKLPALAKMYSCTIDELLSCDEKVGVFS